MRFFRCQHSLSNREFERAPAAATDAMIVVSAMHSRRQVGTVANVWLRSGIMFRTSRDIRSADTKSAPLDIPDDQSATTKRKTPRKPKNQESCQLSQRSFMRSLLFDVAGFRK